MSKIKEVFTSSKITLHELDCTPILVPKRDIAKLVDIANNVNFPELKTQIILDQRSALCAGSRDHWLYVIESVEEIRQLLDKG